MATTLKSTAASRQHGRQSTGPKSLEGKTIASKNATKHGLLSREVVLGDEDADEFARFGREMLKALGPRGEVERSLAARAIAAAWRLRRFERIETLMLEHARKDWRGQEVPLSSGLVGLFVNGDAPSKLSRYEAGIERAFYRALHELQRLQASRAGVPVPLPVAVDIDVTQATDARDSGSFGSYGSEQTPPTTLPTED